MVAWKTKMNINEIQTVLIVSQDAEMVVVWETLFRQKNCYMLNETSAEAALQTARLLTPSLVILDLDLPHLELLDLCRKLRPSIMGTLLLLASKGNKQEICDYYNAGVDECLATPVSPMALLIKSMAWLVRQEWAIPREQSVRTYF